jgi:hypothetical protein
MLNCNCIVFAGGKNLDMKALVHAFHEVIVPFGNDSSQSLAFPQREKGNWRSLTASGLTSLMRIMLPISVKVFKCKPASSEVEPPNWFY